MIGEVGDEGGQRGFGWCIGETLLCLELGVKEDIF